MKNVADPATRYSKVEVKLTDAQQTLHRMSLGLNGFQEFVDVALGGNRSVVVHGIPEQLMKDWKQRKRELGYHVVDLI